MDSCSSVFDRDRHVTFLKMMVEMLPSCYQNQEINRVTLAYFAISGLSILDALDHIDKDKVASWIFSLQAYPNKYGTDDEQFYGFHGSSSSQYPSHELANYNGSHLASTYCALAILKIIDCNLSCINSEAIMTSMRYLQRTDGSFMPTHLGGETDLRFVYCAAAICFMLNDWRGMDKVKAKEFIINCQSYDGGFGLVPNAESHGGATYCAVATLRLMGYLEDDALSKRSPDIDIFLLLEWCLQRQSIDGGFQGRSNKASDTCYAFWVGGVLKILGAYDFIEKAALQKFMLTCQTKYGGFSKFPRQPPDLYHCYYGFCAFSLMKEPGLKPLCIELGIVDFLI